MYEFLSVEIALHTNANSLLLVQMHLFLLEQQSGSPYKVSPMMSPFKPAAIANLDTPTGSVQLVSRVPHAHAVLAASFAATVVPSTFAVTAADTADLTERKSPDNTPAQCLVCEFHASSNGYCSNHQNYASDTAVDRGVLEIALSIWLYVLIHQLSFFAFGF